MCGRGRCTLRADDFPRACHLNGRSMRHVNMDRYRPSYNVSPGFNVPVVRNENGQDGGGQVVQDQDQGTVLHCMKWGLIPSFTKKTEKPDHYRMFNARSESMKEKASFRRLVPSNRCLVSFEGFYEWKKEGSKKQPYYVYLKDERPMVFAALYDTWKNPEGEVLYTFTICTTSASSSLEWLHDRMPVILGNKEATEMWLNGPASAIDTLVKPYEDSDLAWYPVTPAMGKPSFDQPECIKEIQLKSSENRSISQFFTPKGHQASKDPKNETQSSAEINEPKKVKEESNTEASINSQSQPIVNKEEDDVKPSVSAIPHARDMDLSVKQECEGFTAESMNLKDATIKPVANQMSKKRGIESDDTEKEPGGRTKKFAVVGTHTQGVTPAKKKATAPKDKQQPTLFSYFGKG